MASKTYAELAVAADVQAGDLFASYRGLGPLKSVTAAIAKTYFTGGTFPADGSVAMTGTMKGYVGSESLPGYTFDGDTDTGIYRAGANSLGISTGGVLRALFDSNGITGTFIGNLTGNVTGNLTGNVTGAVTGNASTATKWATARNLSLTGDGTATIASVDGSAAVSGALTLATVNANVGSFGTGSAVGTFTVNAKGLVTAASNTTISITDANLSAQVTVPKGGTGVVTLTNHGVMVGQGASSVAVTAAGTAGQPLLSGGAGADPAFGGPLTVPFGGTGAATFTDGGVLIGNAAGVIQATSAGTAGQVLTSSGAGVDPAWSSPTTAWTQIGSTTTISSPVGSVVFSSIPATYSDLLIRISGISHNSGSPQSFQLHTSSNNGSAYSTNGLELSDAVSAATALTGATEVSGYASTIALLSSSMTLPGAAPDIGVNLSVTQVSGFSLTAAAINAIRIRASGGSLDAGALSLWGR